MTTEQQKRKIELHANDDGTGRIVIDGVDYSNSVSAVSVLMRAGRETVVELDFIDCEVCLTGRVVTDTTALRTEFAEAVWDGRRPNLLTKA